MDAETEMNARVWAFEVVAEMKRDALTFGDMITIADALAEWMLTGRKPGDPSPAAAVPASEEGSQPCE